MSSSDTRHVVIQAENPVVEIHLLDHSLQRVAHAWGTLECDVVPGLYLAKFKAGATANQETVVVDPGDGPLLHRGKLLALATATPVYGLPNSHEYQSGPAQATSQHEHENLGGDAQLFLFAREVENDTFPWYEPGRGLTLHRTSGEMILDLGSSGERDSGAAWAAVNARLPAGTYVLRSEHPDAGIVEMAVVASPQFQTQVFVTLAEFTFQAQRTLRLPDLASAAVHMAPVGRGFDANPDNPFPKLTAVALAALSTGRRATEADHLRQMLRGKFEDPMLGILGAHLLLLDPEPDDALLHEVVHNLSYLVGDHPDVLAVRKALGDSSLRFPEPPMLASSWRIAAGAHAVPAGSHAAFVAQAAFGDGPWLMWRADLLPEGGPELAPTARSLGFDPGEVLELVQSTFRLAPREIERLHSSLTPAGQRAMHAIVGPASVASILESDDDEPAPRRDLQEVSRRMQVPDSVAASALEEIAGKLEPNW
ncbi:MAG: hypothetical protein K0Q72_5004 [Armatimonadetes bacterium]|jgi:hypothetical protein|nr:hypothetical protein [Armatimonadota bacterium]